VTANPGLNSATEFTEPTAGPTTRRLYRSRTNRTFSGVCGGIAEHFGSDPTAVRLLTVLVAVFTGFIPMLVLYLIAAIVLPDGPGTAVPAASTGGGQGALVIGFLLLAFGFAALANEWLRVDWDLLWPLAVIAIGGGFLVAAWRR
jgi:phage shock protein C